MDYLLLTLLLKFLFPQKVKKFYFFENNSFSTLEINFLHNFSEIGPFSFWNNESQNIQNKNNK